MFHITNLFVMKKSIHKKNNYLYLVVCFISLIIPSNNSQGQFGINNYLSREQMLQDYDHLCEIIISSYPLLEIKKELMNYSIKQELKKNRKEIKLLTDLHRMLERITKHFLRLNLY